MMPDGTSRLKTMDGQMIYHFMGCSTFAEYAVLASISLAKINPESNPFESCILGCGIPTGWGAVMNNPNFHANSSVAVKYLSISKVNLLFFVMKNFIV